METIGHAGTDADIAASFEVMRQLRPHLEADAYVGRVRQLMEIQLISRVTREQAHRFYFREGFGIECFHFRHAVQSEGDA